MLLSAFSSNVSNRFDTGRALCGRDVRVIMHMKDPQLFVFKIDYCVLIAGFCLVILRN